MFRIVKKHKLIGVVILTLMLFLTQVAFGNVLTNDNQGKDDTEAILKPLRRIKQLDSEGQEIEKNQLKVGEEFIIDYTIQPRDIPVEEVFGDDVAKDKEIVLVMDVSGSMEEYIEFDISPETDDTTDNHNCITDGTHVSNIRIELKNNKSGNSINDYRVYFERPSNYSKNMSYLMVYSKRSPAEVHSYLSSANLWDIIDIVMSGTGELLNWNQTHHSFNNWHLSLEGDAFSGTDQYVYIATLDENINYIGLACSSQSIKKQSNEKNEYTKLDVMKIVASNFLDKFEKDSSINVSVIPYGDLASPRLYNGKNFGNLYLSSDYYDITNQISGFNANGGSNIGDGLRRAYHTFSNNDSKKYIILMTDGVPTAFTLSGISGRRYGYGEYIGYLQKSNGQKEYKDVYSATYITDNSDDNMFFVNYGSYDANYFSLRYAQTMAEIISNDSRDIKTFMIGFSNAADSSKLDSIAEYANGYYKEAQDGNALDEVYQQLAESIQASFSIPEINFEELFQNGIEVVRVEGLNNVNIEETENGTLVTGKAPSVAYNLVEEVDQSSGHVIKYYNAEPVHYRIIAKANVVGNYYINENQEVSFIEYEDVASLIGGEEGNLRKEYFTPKQVDVYTESIPTVNANLEQTGDDQHLLTVSIDDPINFTLTDGKGEVLWEFEDIEQYDNGQYKTYDEFHDFTKEFSFTQEDLIELDALYLNCIDSSGNEFSKSISFIYLEVQEKDDDDFTDDLRPVSLVITTDEGSEVANIKINGIENEGFTSKVTENGVYVHENVYLKEEKAGENIIEVTIKNNDGSFTTQIFKRTVAKEVNGDLISHELYVGDDLEESIHGGKMSLVNSYTGLLGIRFKLSSKITSLEIELNTGNNEAVEDFDDLQLLLYKVDGESVVKLDEGTRLNKVQDHDDPNKYSIEITLTEEDSLDSEYILAYKITPNITGEIDDDGIEVINKAILSETLELETTIKILPLPNLD